MKLHSKYLNPFQPFPEREVDAAGVERPRDAIEDNLSRAVFSALGNAESPHALAIFLEDLAKDGSSALRGRIEGLAEILRTTDPGKVDIGLQQPWPETAVRELPSQNILLIGISSSHCNDWTHDQRPAPCEPRPDAWTYVPEKMLLVFECKNDENPLDATQVYAYAHELGILTVPGVPPPEPGSTLSRENALAVQQACADSVLDARWNAVVAAVFD